MCTSGASRWAQPGRSRRCSTSFQAIEEEGGSQKIAKSSAEGMARFRDTFKQEVLKGAKEAKEEFKRKRR